MDSDPRTGKLSALEEFMLTGLSIGLCTVFFTHVNTLEPVNTQYHNVVKSFRQLGVDMDGPERDVRIVHGTDNASLRRVLVETDIPTIVVANLDYHRATAIAGVLEGVQDKVNVMSRWMFVIDEFQRFFAHQDEGHKQTEVRHLQ